METQLPVLEALNIAIKTHRFYDAFTSFNYYFIQQGEPRRFSQKVDPKNPLKQYKRVTNL